MKARLLTLLAAIPVAIAVNACSQDVETDAASTDQAQSTAGALVLPAPGSTNNPISAADKALIVQQWLKAKQAYYGDQSGFYGFQNPNTGSVQMSTPSTSEAPQYSEVAGVPCPNYYSDLACYFYAHMPSYASVIPNVRGCFSRLANGTLKVPDASGAVHDAVYPEIWDYCMYQDYDVVLGKQPAYSQSTIDANKASGNEVGVLRYMDKDLRPVFQFIMYTWYEPNTFAQSDQDDILSQVYGKLGLSVPQSRASAYAAHPSSSTIKASINAYLAANGTPPKPGTTPSRPPPPPPPPPPPGALPGTQYGATSATGESSWSGGYVAGIPVTIPPSATGAPLTLQQFGAVSKTGVGQPQVIMALYDDAGGSPGNIVADTAATPLAGGDQRITPNAPGLALSPGTYWVMGNFSATATMMTTPGGATPTSYVSHPFGTTFPSNPAVLQFPQFQLNFYVVVQ
jgi:hypothetical protein